jgi:hypothetical protein
MFVFPAKTLPELSRLKFCVLFSQSIFILLCFTQGFCNLYIIEINFFRNKLVFFHFLLDQPVVLIASLDECCWQIEPESLL